MSRLFCKKTRVHNAGSVINSLNGCEADLNIIITQTRYVCLPSCGARTRAAALGGVAQRAPLVDLITVKREHSKLHHSKKTLTPKRVSEFFGPSGDNGFDQTARKSSIYGTCAHFSSQGPKRKIAYFTQLLPRGTMVSQRRSLL